GTAGGGPNIIDWHVSDGHPRLQAMTLAKALLTSGDGQFSLQEVVLGAPETNEVLVQIEASGVCHTDLDMLNRRFPHIMGHEGAGVVEAVGSAITHVSPGDPVLLNWAIPCGQCFQCVQGRENLCAARPYVPRERRQWNGKPI